MGDDGLLPHARARGVFDGVRQRTKSIRTMSLKNCKEHNSSANADKWDLTPWLEDLEICLCGHILFIIKGFTCWELLLLRGKRVDEEDEAREGEREGERERWLMGARPSGRANGKTKK
jgi:hypothetical protein